MVKEKRQLNRYSSSTLDSVIQEVALTVASTLDINEVYEGFALKVRTLVEFDRIYIDVLDLETSYYSVNYMSGSLPSDWRPGKSRRPEGAQTHLVVSTGQPLIRYDIAQDQRFIDDEDSFRAGLRSSIALPLITKGKVIGTLGLQSCRVGAYEAEEQAVLEKLANLIAPSVENATLYQRLQERTQEMALADEVARVITSTLEIDQVYEQFAQEMKKLVDFDRVVINVVDEDLRNFTIKYSAGLDYPGIGVGDTRPLEGTQTQHVVTSGQTLVRPDLGASPRFVGDQALLDVGIKSTIVIPLNSKGKVIGTLIANSRWGNAFGMREQAILERLAKQIAPAVENSELYYQVQAATQEMALVDEVARIITSTLDIGEVYDQFASEMRKLLDFERLVINSVDPEAGTYTLRYIHGQHRPGRPIGVVTALTASQNEEVVRTGQTLIRDDFASNLRFQSDQDSAGLGLRASIMAPLIVKGRIIGTMGLRSRNVGAYGQRERAILERLSRQIAPAIENADLYQRFQESTQEIELVDQVARIITSTLDIDQVYEKFANEMKKLLNFDRAFVDIVDEESGTYVIKYVSGIYLADRLPGLIKPLEGSQVEYVVKSGKTLCRSDVAQETLFKSDEEQMRWGARSSIAVPLIAKGRTIGILGLRSRLVEAYSLREQAILERLASQIAPAIENAELYQQRRQAEEAERLRNQEMEALYGIASTLVQPETFEQRCEAVLELVARAADADSAFIRVASEDGQSLHIVAEINPGRLPSRPTTTVRWGEGLAGTVLKEGRPAVSHDNLVQDLGTGRGRERGARSSVALPVKTGEELLGVINVVSGKPNHFTPERMRLLSAIADGLGMLLENSRLSQELQATAGEMQVADEMAQIITSTLNIDEVYEKFVQELRKHVGFHRMNINFIDSDSNVFTIKYQVGQDQTGYQVGNTLPLEGTQSHRVMLTGQSLVRDDISSDSCFPSDSRMAELGFRSNIVVPLITKGRVIASLSLRSKEVGAYGNREKVILERLAKQIAPAIENAELYRQLQASTEEMEVVNEVARIMTSTLQIDQVCEEFAREMRKLVDFDRASISTVDREAGTYTPQYIFGDPKLNQPIGSVNPLPGTMTGKIEETRRTLVRGDISSPENGEFSDDQAHWEFGLRSCIALPLFSKGQVIGSMLLRSRKTNCYGPREQALLERLVRQIAPAIENARLYDQARGEKELATTTLAQLKGVLSGVDSGLLFVDNNRDTLWANHRYGEFFGIDDVESLATTHRRQADRRETLHKTFADPGRVFDERMRIYAEATFAGPTEEVELVYPVRRILQPFTTPVYDESGESLGRLWVYHDITQSKAAEAQLLQFQKMESIGRLAGGIAHDFNNLLTAIMGYSQLAIMEAPSNGFLCSHIEEIQRAAERASNLTSQLLAFSRRQVVAPKVINLNDLILNLERLLRRLISEDIELVTLPSPDTGPIKIDPNQMEQVLVNLVVNARDAMPSGGKLVIETSNVNVGPQFTQQYLGVATGRYVMLSVSDNGVGMSEEVKAHLFEPFFTTKEVGKGTGLGLATCYGIVKQSGGYIEAVSEPGTGSSIKVYLPCSEEAPTNYPRNDQATPSTSGTETVLLAEDDPLVRSMVANVLTDQGYTVIQASNGDEALRLAQEQGHRRIDLLLSDIVMPQMGGVELARRISNLRPQTKIILTSGYSDEPIFRNGTLDSKIEFIQKPFIPAALASKVRDVLDRDN